MDYIKEFKRAAQANIGTKYVKREVVIILVIIFTMNMG